MIGRHCRKEIDRDGAVVAEREADLAVVVSRRRHLIARRR